MSTTHNYFVPRTYVAEDFASSDESDAQVPVLVVGAGPVGMATALGLARRGIHVTIVEAADRVSFGSRAICLSRHTLEVAERLGISSALENIALPWTGGRSFYRDEEVLHFGMPHRDDDVRGPMVNVSQSEFEQILTDELLAHPLVTFHWAAPISGLDVADSGAAVHLDTAFGTRTVYARWVVAADGGRSRVRELAGLRLSGNSYQGNYVIADIHWPSDLPTERLVWFDPPSNPGSTIIMHRQPRDIWRIDYQLDPSVDAEAENDEARIRERITTHLAWLQNDIPWTLEWHGFYRAHALALDNFVHGPIIFAGDAAHLVPIFGVRGLNSGMEDADTLAWQLAAVIDGRSDRSLLESYSIERRDAWKQNITNAGKSTLVMSPGSYGFRTTRDAVLELATTHPQFGHLLNPRQSSATHARLSPLTGNMAHPSSGLGAGDPVEDRILDVSLDGAIRSTSLNVLRGSDFCVVVAEPTSDDIARIYAATASLTRSLTSAPVRLIPVSRSHADYPGSPTVVDASALLDSWGLAPGECVVIRPDGLVLRRSANLDGLARPLEANDPGIEVPAPPTPELDHLEQVWLTTSRMLDAVAAEDRERVLTRLVLALGAEVTTAQFGNALRT
ncbi:FAD-dependent monooxygenase [Rhodococcus fascians]|nr:FAD-dependent monooxygenase [Rhodococcus fascians]MBY4237885.1 FAD-dependent monooxygenase [Rhodococcus fascians]MBY4253364.1 FAD-dependent monooxygenase [Rhodococcus fascians]MBY4269001.1 FAD-dependent monooxygenase [Rhodococcus fascians]MBY4275054.1 FAD-dependent monooxygenase [Rhodococcus fascians]